MPRARKDEPVVIKKYANRRLYDTESSMYVTLEDLCRMVKEGREFVVYDAKTDEDLTRQVLTQIIFEQETRGQHLLPINFLRSLITYYDDNMKEVLPHYLESSMQAFMDNQEKMRAMMGSAMKDMPTPFGQLEEITRQNMELFRKTFSMFNPFDAMFGPKGGKK